MATIYEVLQKFADVKEELPPVDWVEPRPRCERCRDRDVSLDGEICPLCERELQQGYEALTMTGRCANGAQRDGGILYHAVPLSSSSAFCGAKHGKRSRWSEYHGGAVTCPRCIAKLAKIEQRAKVATEMHMSRLKWLASTKG